ncbi:MAG: tRNA guanosine(34) transglycosylase Tgt [Myxococcaceae bacterium]|nr:tRNA guanosine(34) transglycosylase Tgt [Myxococcaceae bacterium]
MRPVNSPIRYELLASTPSGARAGLLHTRRGVLETPAFMPVATHAHVRFLTMDDVAESGARFCLANTYHLLLRPGTEVFERTRGIHGFMQWPHGVLTDSGGFQIFSLPGEREITEAGARFRSPYDNHRHLLSPESSIATQNAIGSDIMMVLDVCPPSTSPEDVTRDAMERTHRWALRSLAARDAAPTGQALFAIVQGGVFPALRTESAQFLTEHPFDGFAIGGLAVGESRELLYSMTGHTAPKLPTDRPRYLMGVGTPIDLVECVHRGVDMFDCIIPPKMAQQGYAYTFEGQLRLSKHEYRFDETPIDPTCDCFACRRYTRAYVRHLTQGGHHLGTRLLAVHNLRHFQVLTRRMRTAILENRWDAEYRELVERLSPKTSKPKPTGQSHGAFEVVKTRSGAHAVRHQAHGEVMHPVGPWEEANRLYVEQTKLEARLAVFRDEPFRILDVGLGAGANAVAALTKAQAMGQARRREVEIISLESDLAAFELALSAPEAFPFLQPWKGAAEALLQQGHWDGPGLHWRVLVGDARETIDGVPGWCDLIFFDPFSPEANPTLWTVDFLRSVRGHTNDEGGLLVTYSSATPTRVSFLLAGFFVGQGLSTGTRTETTNAATQLANLDQPLGERWLTRWKRSSARGPHGAELTPELERHVLEHPQFGATGRRGEPARPTGSTEQPS